MPLHLMSLPSRERGLKYGIVFPEEVPKHVAPLAGARIEIKGYFKSFFSGLSLPSRERGLKFASEAEFDPTKPSLPSRERGLK